MNYWEESKNFVYDALDKAGKTTDKFVSIQKAKAKLYKLNRSLDEIYISLGKTEYDSVKNGTDCSSKKEGFVSDIDKLLSQIETARIELKTLTGTQSCKICGYDNKSDAVFCSGCGNELN